METLLSIIIVIASILLVFVVFVQNPKGGGLSSDFGGSTQLGGVQKTNEFIDKATWSLAGIIAVLSIILTIQMKSIAPVEAEPEPETTENPATSEPNQNEGATQAP